MPDCCILQECAHHSPNKQQTFSSEFDRADHWEKYHREVLDCLLTANPACQTYLGMENSPSTTAIIFILMKEQRWPIMKMSTAHSHIWVLQMQKIWQLILTQMIMKNEASEEDTEVQLGNLDPMFKLAMEICPSYHRREFEFEFDLWNNRPDTSDEAVNREISLQMREPPSTSSPL